MCGPHILYPVPPQDPQPTVQVIIRVLVNTNSHSSPFLHSHDKYDTVADKVALR